MNATTTATVTMTEDAFDDVALRLEQVGAMIDALRIQIGDAEEVAVSSKVLAVALSGYSTFIEDIGKLMRHADGTKAAGVSAP